MKIPIHSVTDLITNSSTTIFTYSEGSEKALVEMIDELFKTFGIDKKCEDVFDSVVLADSETYTEYDDIPEEIKEDEVEQLYINVVTGKVPKPDWFKEAENQEGWSYYTPDTYLHLIPKKPEYENLGRLINSFLYSTNHEATRDG